MEVVTCTFQTDIAQKLLQIPLEVTDSEDLLVWKGEPSGEFSIRSAYKLLQEANPDPINLRCKRLTTNIRCPRCGSGEENSLHVFQQCPISMEIWQNINMSWVTSYRDQNIRTWLTWVFVKGTKEQCQSSRNQMVHEKKLVSGRDLVQKIQTYLAKLEGVGKEKRTLKTVRIQRQRKEKTKDTIQFDAAFDANRGICMPTSNQVRHFYGSPISYNNGGLKDSH
ncbi:hypothetical protein GOBAR_DD12509 [Gossypium barbadense]|nr:hypothetical protein GOBAR_DD12509 [Gossypium barbadense]